MMDVERQPSVHRRRRAARLAAALGYVALLASMSGGLWQARRWAMRELSSPEARADWQRWKRHVMETQTRRDAIVKWRAPKSDEPPLLILLRDDFPAVVGGCLLIVSFLYAFLVIVLRGMLVSPASPARAIGDETPRP